MTREVAAYIGMLALDCAVGDSLRGVKAIAHPDDPSFTFETDKRMLYFKDGIRRATGHEPTKEESAFFEVKCREYFAQYWPGLSR